MATKLRDVTERLFAQMTGETLARWVEGQRAAGTSWRQIERELRDEHKIEVSNVTLIAWYGERETAA